MHSIIKTLALEHYRDHEATKRHLEHQLAQPKEFRVLDEDVTDEDIKSGIEFHRTAAEGIKAALDGDVSDEAVKKEIKKPWVR